MMVGAIGSQQFELPWWLEGSELCGFCYQQYAVELEYRCAECDGPICPLCVVVRETRQSLCPQCTEQSPE